MAKARIAHREPTNVSEAEGSEKRTPPNISDYPTIEFPLRRRVDRPKFFLYLGILPCATVAGIAALCGWLLFPQASLQHLTAVAILHLAALAAFLLVLWIPVFLAITRWPEWLELSLTTGSAIIIIGVVLLIFPHQLITDHLLVNGPFRPVKTLYYFMLMSVFVFYLVIGFRHNRRTAFRDVRAAADPQARKHPDRWLWFDAVSFFMTLFAVVVFEMWFLAMMGHGKFASNPYERFGIFNVRNLASAQSSSQAGDLSTSPGTVTLPAVQPADSLVAPIIITSLSVDAHSSDSSLALVDTLLTADPPSPAETRAGSAAIIDPFTKFRMTKLSWFGCSFLTGLVFFLWACLPNRLMRTTLVPVTFHERDVEGVIFKSHRYLYHLGRAMLIKYPFLILGGLLMTMIFLLTPAILTSSNRADLLQRIVDPDTFILGLGIFIAWFSPVALAVVMPDETFGEYFDRRLADHIMMVQGHIVFIGFGSLGKRVIDREISQIYNDPQPRQSRNRGIIEIVTPDLRLEKLCGQAVVVEKNPIDVIYSGTTLLLGSYGVVSTYRRMYRSIDPNGKLVHLEKRVLVPVVIGEAREPFISSRVNLERARLIISMVPDEAAIHAIYERSGLAGIPSIICVTRSDQITYLTYRSRHRPIVLVYPKHNQGITLGYRLWTAILKIKAIRQMSPTQWPNVVVIGNNKANHYMLETLWTSLPGDHNLKRETIESKFAFVIPAANDAGDYPRLQASKDNLNYDRFWPSTYITGGRFPYPPDPSATTKALNIRTRVVNAADIQALETCLGEHRPDIVIIHHENVEHSLIMLSRCMRGLERLKVRFGSQMQLPLLLLSSARGDEWERLSLGDSARYYEALCNLYGEDTSSDLSYPSHSRYDHLKRELIGESISDSLDDAEEIIAGARSSFLQPGNPQFVEVNSCMANLPGTLAEYTARLGGIEFQSHSKQQIESLWLDDESPHSRRRDVMLPSFQYLRNIMLDPERNTFALNGYATLVPYYDESFRDAGGQDSQLVVRVLANDGRNYIEQEFDEDEWRFQEYATRQLSNLRQTSEPHPPGVPDVINRLMTRDQEQHVTVDEFRQTLLDPSPDSQGGIGPYACPGMPICRIAAFQDYIVASNTLRLQRIAANPAGAPPGEKLLHARNYSCCGTDRRATAKEIPRPESPYARLFCCCHGSHDPGMIAMVINTLLFRSNYRRHLATGDPARDWVINIDYFKEIVCQNSHFTLNRMFGFLENKPAAGEGDKPLQLPLYLLRILPIGAVANFQSWFYYARALHRFLNSIEQPHKFKFYWLDGERNAHGGDETPPFEANDRRRLPVVLVIKRGLPAEARRANSQKHCDVCGLQPKEYDCHKLRAWV